MDLPDRVSSPERVRAALAVPLARALACTLLDDDRPFVGVRFPVADLADNGAGSLHASAAVAAMELAGYLVVEPTLAADEHAVTHASALQLVATAAAGEQVTVRPTLDRRTRRVAFVSVVAEVDGRLIARAQLTKSIVSARRAPYPA